MPIAPNMRVMPPGNGVPATSITVNGRNYSCAIGSTIDVPSHDGKKMTASGWISGAPDGGVGSSALRPTLASGAYRSMQFLDTSVGKVIIFDGVTWRDPMTGAAV